jgi:hypothetical protein
MNKFIKIDFDYVNVEQVEKVEFITVDLAYSEVEEELEVCGESSVLIAKIILKNGEMLPIFTSVYPMEDNIDESIEKWYETLYKQIKKVEEMFDNILNPYDFNEIRDIE